MLYNVVLVSTEQQSETAIHILPLFQLSSPQYRIEFPELYSRFSLVIYLIHVSVGTSLVVQWLRFHTTLPTQGARVQFQVWELDATCCN